MKRGRDACNIDPFTPSIALNEPTKGSVAIAHDTVHSSVDLSIFASSPHAYFVNVIHKKVRTKLQETELVTEQTGLYKSRPVFKLKNSIATM